MNASTPESLRLFFALWPDDATRTALLALQAAMRGRLVPYDNLHLTLAFLGQQQAAALPALKDVLAHVPPSPLQLTLDRAGYFTRNRVVWVGMHDTPDALLTLQQELIQDLQRHAVAFRQEHGFKPHVTLARDAALPADLVFTPIVWHAREIALVQSVTDADGTRYSVLASRSLEVECWTKNAAAGDTASRPV
jgi:RNA 2',3'-cyclic 3'-phosphodiesterase